MGKLYGNGVIPRCLYCEHGQAVQDSEHINCRYKGVVTDGYSCRRFRYDPLKRVPHAPPALPRFSHEDFSIDDDISER